MKSLSGALSAALGAPVQRPALLVQVDFSTVQRWSSMATLSWGGHSWTARNLRVEGLQVQALRVQGSLLLGNADGVAGALVLAQGVQDRAITLYGYDAAATASGDVVWLASAVGAAAQVGPGEVSIALRHRAEFTASPRTYVTYEAGFGQMLPPGTVVRINGVDVRLDRRG